MQREAEAVAAEGVGEDDVGAGGYVLVVNGTDQLGSLDVQKLWRPATLEAASEQGRSHCSIGHQRPTGFEKVEEGVAHVDLAS